MPGTILATPWLGFRAISCITLPDGVEYQYCVWPLGGAGYGFGRAWHTNGPDGRPQRRPAFDRLILTCNAKRDMNVIYLGAFAAVLPVAVWQFLALAALAAGFAVVFHGVARLVKQLVSAPPSSVLIPATLPAATEQVAGGSILPILLDRLAGRAPPRFAMAVASPSQVDLPVSHRLQRLSHHWPNFR